MHEVYLYALQCNIDSRRTFAKQKINFRKTKIGQKGRHTLTPLHEQSNRTSEKHQHNLKTQYLGKIAGSYFRFTIGINLYSLPIYLFFSPTFFLPFLLLSLINLFHSIHYISTSSRYYAPNLFLIMLICHYLYSTYIFINIKLIFL